LENSFGQLL